MVSPTRAVLLKPIVAVGSEVSLVFPSDERRVAKAIFYKTGLALVLDVQRIPDGWQLAPLALDRPKIAMGKCFSRKVWFSGRLFDDEGATDMEFDPEYAAGLQYGSPVVAAGELVGILDYMLDARVWRLLSSFTIAHALKLADGLIDDFDEETFLARLHPSARTALAYAAALRLEGDGITVPLLIWGLYRVAGSTTRRLFTAKGIDESMLLFRDDSLRGDPPPISELPPITDDVSSALIAALRIANENRAREIRGRHILAGLLSAARPPTIEMLTSRGITADVVQLTDTHSIIGHRADTADGPDLLNITNEARALASVLAASKVEPPISVGLFGEWGSGKSFFMREMHRQFEIIENDVRAGKENYCGNIVQIWFNAWHYIDANLWASLAAEVFERLDAELTIRTVKTEKDQRAKDRAVLLAENAQSRSRLEQAAREQNELEEELQRIQSNRDDLRDERTVAASLGLRSVYTAAAEAIVQTPETKEGVASIRDEIGKAKASLKIDEATLREAKGFAGAAKIAWRSKPARVTTLLLVLLVLLTLFGPRLVKLTRDFLLVIAPIFVVAAGFLAKYLPYALRGLRAIGRAWRIKENLIAKERARRLAELEARESAVAERLAQSKKDYEDAALAIESNEAEIAKLEPQRQISTFIHERRKSTDYTKHLGVIASAHDDFQHLSTLLSKAKGTKSDEKVPTIDRIILYIDDLDRCPEDKVVDVLQAVHLLLAFPLFVVVVGVDSRWLLHSLQRHLKQFTAEEEARDDELGRALWESTPINYLEKIFQIPFTIRPMRSGAFGTLIDNLALPQDKVVLPRFELPRDPLNVELRDPVTNTTTPATMHIAGEHPLAVTVSTVALQLQPTSPPSPPPTPTEYLTLQKWETDFMKVLYPLIPSPRAAKRFVNIYRLMRGMIDEYERPGFSGAEDAQGYRAALLMLAMLAGHPEEASDLLQELVTKRPANDWWTFVDEYVAQRCADNGSNGARERWTKLKERLAQVERPVNRPAPPCQVFIHWAPDVARFSFYSGRVFATRP